MGRIRAVVLVAVVLTATACTSGDGERAEPAITTTRTTEPYRPAELHDADVAIRLYNLTEDTDGYALEQWLSSAPGRELFGDRIVVVTHEDATQSIYVYLTSPLAPAERLAVYRALHDHPAVVRLDFYEVPRTPPVTGSA
jgi:hypothetical protein